MGIITQKWWDITDFVKENGKAYKVRVHWNISNLRIVSMSPGDREVAGCFFFLSGVDF